MGEAGQPLRNSQDKTAKTGVPGQETEQDIQDWTATKGQLRQDSQDRTENNTTMTGQRVQDSKDRSAGRGKKCKTTVTGQPGKDTKIGEL